MARLELTTKALMDHQLRMKRKRTPDKPKYVQFLGNLYEFNPDCELPDNVARRLVEKRPNILKYAKEETFNCQYCGQECKNEQSLRVHEGRWCKEKP